MGGGEGGQTGLSILLRLNSKQINTYCGNLGSVKGQRLIEGCCLEEHLDHLIMRRRTQGIVKARNGNIRGKGG